MENKKKYHQSTAIFAIAKASLRSILRSPSAVIFSLLFPLIFIVVFGFIGNSKIKVDVGVNKNCDVNNPVYKSLEKNSIIHLITQDSNEKLDKELSKGKIDAILNIQKNPLDGIPAYTVHVNTCKVSMEKGNILKSVLTNIFYELNMQGQKPIVAELKEVTIEGREFKSIDFILPGQLGFSLLSSGVFGTAFVFLSLRIQLVIKRFFATPVKRSSIVIGETISRMLFALMGAVIIITIGHFLFGFTLINGFKTVFDMLLLSALGLIVFMGFGFAVSGIAKNEASVPPIANLITLPQFLLSGTFFSISTFPTWLQAISNVLPLTYLNDGLRKIAFEGAGLWDIRQQIFIILLWGIGVIILAVKVFKWE